MISTLTESLTSALHASRAMGYLGIDMGTDCVKVAQVRRRGRQFVLESARVVTHRMPLDPKNASLSLELMLESLDQAWAPTGHWFLDEAACLLPLPLMLLRTIDLPSSDPDEQQRTIESELSHDASLSADKMIFECWRETKGDSRTAAASVLGVGTSLVEEFAGALYQRGLACEVLDGLPFALSRAVTMGQTISAGASEPIAAVDWGYESGLVTVSVHGTPAYTRPLRGCGFRHVIDVVAKELGLEPKDTRHLICGSATALATAQSTAELQETVFEMAAAPLQRFEEELSRTITFLRQQRPSIVPGKLCLMGGGATLRGVAPWVEHTIGVPTSVWELPPSFEQSSHHAEQIRMLAPAIALSTLRIES
ncbi:MAG: pilus assembly protein PilM [Planctomycetaceae bacterium]|nr:pilus assembly protein PilM [Planctomycetaceae bacterium]